jgi:hypothetical protein
MLKFDSRSCAIDYLKSFLIIFSLLKLLSHDATVTGEVRKYLMQFRYSDNSLKEYSPGSAGKAQKWMLIPHKAVTFVFDA